jgi:putative hemolysin
MNVFFEILIILLLVLGNGIFAMSEIAMISARRSRLEERAKQGKTGAKVALEMSRDMNRFLSTIQIGITLVGIFAGAYGGATLAGKIGNALAEISFLRPYAYSVGIVTVVLVTTYITLVFGELVPKRIALNGPDAIAMRLARPMRFLSKIATPLVALLSKSTNAIMSILPVGPAQEPVITEDEIRIMMERGTKAGILDKIEQDIVDRALRLDDFKVDAIMTPGTRIKWLDLEDDAETILRKAIQGGRTRYPVCRKHLDNVVGVVRVRDLFAQALSSDQQNDINLESILFQPVFVVESMPALRVLELFRTHHTHIAIILDEFGAVEGLVTMHDFLEEIVGRAPAYKEEQEPYAIQRDDGTWLVDGLMPITDFVKKFDIPEFPLEEKGDYYTLAGFVVTRLGKIPVSSDRFKWGDYIFEIMDMDGKRVDKVLLIPPEADSAD